MKYYPEIGITAPDLGWVPAPTYILRRGAILDVIAAWDKGSVLEMGCGSGSISYEMALRGFSCTAVETSEKARNIAEQLLANSANTQTIGYPPVDRQFDYLISFEVLEHIRDDEEALRSWLSMLRPGGQCLISVPAHQHKWNIADIAAGHY